MAEPAGNTATFIQGSKMTTIQYVTIFICFLMNMLDGMDVLVIAFTAPTISDEWAVSPKELGVVFSSALMGMTLGALFVAPLADRIGRKNLMLFCAALMGLSIFGTAFSLTVPHLMVFRLVSGLGIGGMLASSTTLASEYAPPKTKDFWVGLVVGGYPVGAVLAGLLSSYVIPEFGWRTMFMVAGTATLVTVPLIYFYLSPSLDFLVKKRPRGALERMNKVLEKLDQQPLKVLPDTHQAVANHGLMHVFADGRKATTVKLWLAFFMAFASLYFLVSWIPKLTTEAGLSERLGIYAGTVFNLGSFIGILVMGGLAVKIGLKKTISSFLMAAATLMCIFGLFKGSAMILVLFALIGFAMQAGFVGMYPLAAKIYPADIRATGIGWAIGAGRFGAILGPILAGYLISAGIGLTLNFIFFSIPCAIGSLLILSINQRVS